MLGYVKEKYKTLFITFCEQKKKKNISYFVREIEPKQFKDEQTIYTLRFLECEVVFFEYTW